MTEDRPASVWVTRPEPGARDSCRTIEAAGFRAVAVPTLEIAPPDDPAAVTDQARRDLARAQLAVFVSRNAVDWLWRLLGPEAAACVEQSVVVAVGPGTAAALQAQGITAITPDAGADSEALLQLPQLGESAVAGRDVVIIRGRGGRELLAETLRRRGARIHYIEVYVRQQCTGTAERLAALWRDDPPTAIIVTSPAGLDALVAMTAASEQASLLTTPLVCLGRRLPERARELGFRHCLPVPPAEGDQGMVQALHQAQLARQAHD